MKQNIVHNHTRLTFYFALLISWLQHSHVREVLLTYGKHTHVTPKRRGRLLAISCSFEFPFCFSIHAYAFFYTDTIKINRKSIPWNRKPSCVVREKDRQVIKTTSNLVFKLIIALIWKIRSPSQFSKCRNSHVKTINIATIDAITMVSGLRTSSEGEITKSPRNFHVPKVPTTTRFYATCIHEFKSVCFLSFLSSW